MKSTINPDLLIPPDSDLAHLLRQFSEDNDTRTWSIARITNDLIAELEGGIATRQDIYKAVAVRCKGKKPDTIRRWAEVEADFDRDVQDQYKELLSFDMFKFSRRMFHEGVTPSIDYVLSWAVESNDMKLQAGKFRTVGEAMYHFLPDGAFENTLKKTWSKSKERLYDLMLVHDHDIQREAMLKAWKVINDILV